MEEADEGRLTENFEEAGAVRDRLVDDTLLPAVPDPHVLRHAVDGAHVRVRTEKHMLYLCLLLIYILNCCGSGLPGGLRLRLFLHNYISSFRM